MIFNQIVQGINFLFFSINIIFLSIMANPSIIRSVTRSLIELFSRKFVQIFSKCVVAILWNFLCFIRMVSEYRIDWMICRVGKCENLAIICYFGRFSNTPARILISVWSKSKFSKHTNFTKILYSTVL